MKIIYPHIPAEIPVIELESDLEAPTWVQVRSNKMDIADCLSAARASAGLGDDTAPNTETRGVDVAPDTSKGLDDNADPEVVPDVKDNKLPGLTSQNEDDDNDSNDDEDSVENEELDKDSVGDEEAAEPSTIQITSYGRVSRPLNSLIEWEESWQ